MPTLTKRQKQILRFLERHITEHGFSPSYREIADHFGLSSPATVHQHIQTLADKEFISMSNDGGARTIEIIEPVTAPMIPAIMLPLSGLITAGEPIEAVENDETIAIPANFVVNKENSFVLKVKGESMIEEGIFNGDFVVVERNPSPKDGDTVVALLDNAYATLKKFYRESDHIRLQPANSTMKPILVKDLIVQGVVRAVIRNFQNI